MVWMAGGSGPARSLPFGTSSELRLSDTAVEALAEGLNADGLIQRIMAKINPPAKPLEHAAPTAA